MFVICTSTLMRSLLKSLAHFLIGLLVFLLLSFKGSLYTFNSPSSNVFYKYFLPACFYSLLTVSFAEKFLILMLPNLKVLKLIFVLFIFKIGTTLAGA